MHGWCGYKCMSSGVVKDKLRIDGVAADACEGGAVMNKLCMGDVRL